MTQENQAASAEKRALWEVRQRYGVVNPPIRRSTPAVSNSNNRNSAPPEPPKKGPEKPSSSKPKPHKRGKLIKRVLLAVILLFILTGGVFSYKILAASNKISTANRSMIGQLSDLFFSQGRLLKGEKDDRINILLLAIGGEGHSGENLTDTIMIISFRPSDNSVALLSVPRDLYVQVPNEQYFSKLNAVHAYAEAKKAGSGPDAIKEKITEITGLPIHYYARVDFTGFKEIVDAVGGVNVTIPNSFFDYWHKISFSAGTETMNGDRALAYVRARYIEGPEGGDFKRAGRQQQVLLALRDKVFSVNTALDFNKINGIIDSVSNNLRTDMDLGEIKRFYEIARTVDRNKVNSVVLTTGPKGVLVGSTVVMGGVPASILKPRLGDQNYSEIQAIAQDIFNSNNHIDTASANNNPPVTPPAELLASSSPSPSPSTAPAIKPTVEIRNGTNITGLAKSISDKLTSEDYTVTGIANAATRTNTSTTIYTLTQRGKDGSQNVSQIVSGSLKDQLPSGEKTSSADILIILGEDAKP